jgi:hypothetical protein
MRTASFVALVCLAGFTAEASSPLPSFRDSPYRAAIPDPGPCDVIVNESNFRTILNIDAPSPINDPRWRVYCVEPGDYRAIGQVQLRRSGTPEAPRFLRFHADDGVENAVQREERAIFETIRIVSDWWVIQGLTVEPLDPATTWFLSIYGGDHVVVDGNLIDGGAVSNTSGHIGIVIKGFAGNPAVNNTVQRNLVRNGNRNRLPVDFGGILVGRANAVGEDNDHNHIVDNEVVDWGDGVGVGGAEPDCAELGMQHGTVIDGNDLYATSAMRIDCDTGAPNPNGECSCVENGIDVKAAPDGDPASWTRITNNRVWGFRPTSDTASCGGSGSNGQAINAGNSCARHVVVAKNVVMDSTTGINTAGTDWIIAGNLLHEIRATEDTRYGAMAISVARLARYVDIQFNTVVNVDTAYDDAASEVDTRCNAIIDSSDLTGTAGPRGSNHVTEYNYLYRSPADNFAGTGNEQFATPEESRDTEFCFSRKRWSSPQRVCIPLAGTTEASPHLEAVPHCDPDVAAPFGMASIGFPRTAPAKGCGLGAEIGVTLALLARAPVRRRSRVGLSRLSRR